MLGEVRHVCEKLNADDYMGCLQMRAWRGIWCLVGDAGDAEALALRWLGAG